MASFDSGVLSIDVSVKGGLGSVQNQKKVSISMRLNLEHLLLTWNEWCCLCLCNQSLPVHIAQPKMIFDFMGSIQSQSIRGLALQDLVDEVCSLHGPALGDVSFPQVDLF